MPLVPRDRRKLTICLLVILLLSLGAQLQRFLQQYRDASPQAQKAGVGDFPVYYVASLVARQSGDRTLYDPPKNADDLLLNSVPEDTRWGQIAKAHGFGSTMRFIYPPFAALLLEPMGLWDGRLSLLLWRIVLTGLMLVSIYLILIVAEADNLLLQFVLSTLAALSFFPVIETSFQGQIDPVILLSWIAGVYFMKADRPAWSALSFAVGTWVKVSPVAVVGLFLLRRQWRWLLSYAAWMLALLGVSVWRLGWENHVIWFRQIFPGLSCGVAYFANKSVPALLYDLYLRQVPVLSDSLVPPYVCTLAKGVSALLYLGVLYSFWRRNKTSTALVYELTVFALVTVLISPVGWRHHYLLALIPLIYFWVRCQDTPQNLLAAASATLVVGTVFPDYLLVALRNPVLDLVLVSLVPVTSLYLLWVLCANQSCDAWNVSPSRFSSG